MAKTVTIGSVIKNKDGGTYIKLNPGVEIRVDGKLVSSSKNKKGADVTYINIDDPRTLPKKLLELGAISGDVAEKMLAAAAKTPDFVKFNLSAKVNE